MNAMPRATESAEHDGGDYDLVRKAIEFISLEWRDQPSVEAVAAHVGLPSFALQRLFARWAGLTPKAFLQAVTLNHARKLLAGGAPLLEASHDLGLSGPSRLHDLFVAHEAMTPGAFARRGEGLLLRWGVAPSPFGPALAVLHEGRLAGLGFVDAGDVASGLADFERRWPGARFAPDPAAAAAVLAQVFDPRSFGAATPLRVVFIGTDFEIRVWEALLDVRPGAATTYSALAVKLGRPKAARAIGGAVGRNPISFVVPCHRVLGKGGALTGYHWGLTRKRAMLGWEAGRAGG
jgi:AraC family transcriptional regulator of adaptative response/methylated-DNA-[protein]-cysteine methyltransferase